MTPAYIGGFFDADGCVSVTLSAGGQRGHSYFVVRVLFSQSNKAFLEELREAIGMGFISGAKTRGVKDAIGPHYKKRPYDLVVNGSEQVLKACELLIPVTLIKRPQLEAVRDYLQQYGNMFAPGVSRSPENMTKLRAERDAAAAILKRTLSEMKAA